MDAVTGTQHRKDMPLPAGWRVSRGGAVQVLDHAKLHPAELPVRGRWHVVDRAPEGWWLQPSDEVARWWMDHHGGRAGARSGCIQVHGLRLVPGHLDLGPR